MPIFLLFGAAGLVAWIVLRSDTVASVVETATGVGRETGTDKLDPEFAAKLAELIAALEARGFKPVIWESYRSPARQAWLYASGRTRDGAIVTNIETSGNHGAGKAADLVDGRAHPDRAGMTVGWGSWLTDDSVDPKTPGDTEAAEMAEAFFDAVGEEAAELGLEWGGDWSGGSLGADKPHVEIA